MSWYGPPARAGEDGGDLGGELVEDGAVDVELPVEVRAHLALYLVDLAEREHALADDGPGLVRVRVVADDLGRDHERGQEEAVARRAAGGREALLEALEEEQRRKGDDVGQSCPMQGIGDEHGEVRR
jgi:hypothetical protein